MLRVSTRLRSARERELRVLTRHPPGQGGRVTPSELPIHPHQNIVEQNVSFVKAI
jgi:hypothetical protein